MATAKKLPSGSWRVRVFDRYEMVDGKKKPRYQSFTSTDKSKNGKWEAERMASAWTAKRAERRADTSLLNIVNLYVESKRGVLSPNTVRGYQSYINNWISDIGDMSIRAIDQFRLQQWVAELSAEHSPKTVRNVVMFLQAAYKEMTGETLKVTIPKPKSPDLYTPSDDDLKKLLDHVRGKDLEIAIMLSAFCSLRRGEICALNAEDFQDGMVHVSKGMARLPNGSWEIRVPKTPGSDRWVPVPEGIMKLIEGRKGRIIDCHPDALTNRFKRAIKFSHVRPFRFHDLRHYYASTAHYLGIPDAYIMANGGWSTDSVMKRVYREALRDKQKEENDKIVSHMTQFMPQ